MLPFSFLPEKVKKEIEVVIQECLIFFSRFPIKAIVLGGAFKDKEVVYRENSLVSDLDIYLFSNHLPFFWGKVLLFEKEINYKTSLTIDFHFALPILLSKSRTYWAYRLKYQGVVLRGDQRILTKIRAEKDNLSKLEAFRVLFWNLTLWLNSNTNPDRILRSYLNLGEAILVYFQRLAPTFKEKKEEFLKLKEKINLSNDLSEKIIFGYDVRLNLKSPTKEFSLKEARKDNLYLIDYLLRKSGVENLSELKVNPKIWLNFIFYLRLKKAKLKPKFFSLVFQFKITHLWQMVYCFHSENWPKLTKLIEKFFQLKQFSEETLIQIFQLYPLYSILEI